MPSCQHTCWSHQQPACTATQAAAHSTNSTLGGLWDMAPGGEVVSLHGKLSAHMLELPATCTQRHTTTAHHVRELPRCSDVEGRACRVAS